MNKSNKFSPEVRERAVRMVFEHRSEHPSLWAAVESIAAKIGCTPQTLLSWVRRHERDSGLRDGPTTADEQRVKDLERIWRANMQVYGADKVWRQLNREGIVVARCTVEHLMQRLGLRGVIRGKVVRTTISGAKAPCPLDRVNRVFKADRPTQLRVSDFTHVSTWQGWLSVAFVIDVFARRIVEGHSKLEAIRCLKRYIAREVSTLIRQRTREIAQTQFAA